MSQIYISAVIVILSQVLPLIPGVSLGNDQITNLAQALVAIVAGLWVLVRRVQQGDIKASGVRK